MSDFDAVFQDLKDSGIVVELTPEQAIVEKLEALAELQAHRAVIGSEYDVEIARLEAYRDEKCADVDKEIEALKEEIKDATKAHGKSVKGSVLQACWSKPRVTWNDDALCGFATQHPELFAFRKEGDPGCSIRIRK